MQAKGWHAVWLAFLLCLLCAGAQAQETRALLIGVDEFVSKQSIAPASTNNVQAMQEMLLSAETPLAAIVTPDAPITDEAALTALIEQTFRDAADEDVSILYMSTHGVYDPASGEEPRLLLSDGVTEGSITPSRLESVLKAIRGTKLIILDACNSGAFIGKGMAQMPEQVHFLGDEFKVLASSGALEESWYWNADNTIDSDLDRTQGAFYFTQALCQGLGTAAGYPADQNRDGAITLLELYDHLLQNHAASTPQVYPQEDDFVVLRYDVDAPARSGMDRAPIVDVTFSGTSLTRASRQINIEFIATRPVRVAYQVVYQRMGKWEFDEAQLIYDAAERFTAFGDRAGAVSAGRKVRTLTIGELPGETYGYVLVQVVTIDQGKLTVHAGRVISVPPAVGEVEVTVSTEATFRPSGGRELGIFVAHDYPCALSVAIVDEDDRVVRRLCHRQSTRPMQLEPSGSVFYWNGKLKSGELAQSGAYRVRAQAVMNDITVTAYSNPFIIPKEVY